MTQPEPKRPLRALIAGADGGLGRAVAGALNARGHEVFALGRKALDVTRRNEVQSRVSEVRPDVIFDAAGFTDVDACEYDKWQAYLVNRDGAEHLARAADAGGALMVYPSTDLVFDGARGAPYREEDPPNPLSVYGDTKLAGELAVMSHASRHLIVRMGWLFGPYGWSYINDLLSWINTEEVIFGYEDQVCQPTYQLEVAEAILELVEGGRTGLYHAAGIGGSTHCDVARETYVTLGGRAPEVKAVTRATGPRAALRPRYSVLDCMKLAGAGVRMRPWQLSLRDHLKMFVRK